MNTGDGQSEPQVKELNQLASELKSLGRLLRRFNFFLALGASRNELRHSDFLRFLLTPTESHGLGDAFLKHFVLRSIRESPTATPEFRAELARSSLQDTLVEREEDRIDLLIVNERLRFGVVVENKMGTGEHDNQLERYWSTIRSKYPRLSHRFGVLLSPRGITASHPEYRDFAYTEVGSVLEQAATTAGTALDPDARVVVRHYVELLRSEFMENAEAAAVAWKIWMEHRSVIEFLRRNAPSAQLCAELKRLVDLTPLCEYEKIKGREEPYELAFVLRGWRVHPHIGDPGGKSGYKSSLLFWFDDFSDQIKLSLGVWERRTELLRRLSDLGSSEAVFRGHRLERQEEWVVIWSREFASALDLKAKTKDQIFQRLRERWAKFCHNELAAISTAVLKHVPNQPAKRAVASLTNR